MPLFSRFKSKGAQPAKAKEQTDLTNGKPATPRKPQYETSWQSKTVVLEEVQELIHACTVEMKSRAEALDSPFLLLPFRPDSDSSGARSFIRNFYQANSEGSSQYRGAGLQQELRLTDPVVLCSIIKWCWSRIPGGVVSWPVYEGFQIGEKESNLARNAFDTFIPIGAASEARKSIIFDFFDALAAVAAHGKLNGLGGRKLSRLAGWWAFDHSDDGKGFEGGYKSWTAAADATSHLFFAYLRSLSPEAEQALALIERIPRSLQALLASTEYPPETPTLLQRSTPRVVMLVDSVSPTPFALLRRAKHFEFRESDRVLREYSEFEDPLDALTEECKRVLFAISSTNSAAALSRHGPVVKTGQESWNAFQNLGFSDLDDKSLKTSEPMPGSAQSGLRSQARSRNADHGRPTTPSWADFLSSGFTDDDVAKTPSTLSLPYDKVLPPIGSRVNSPVYSIPGEDANLAPGELAAVTNVDLDDAFWWVWMTSLAGEEPSDRKGVFGRCALIETTIMNGRWLIMEEQVKGASPDPTEGAYLVPKKSLFSFTKRGRNKKPTKLPPPPAAPPQRAPSTASNKPGLAPDQQNKIKAAAAALTRKQNGDDVASVTGRRGRNDEAVATKTSSVLTSGMLSEASPAMKWASAYDKHAIRAQYLGDAFAGKGASREDLVRKASSTNVNGDTTSLTSPAAPALSPAAASFQSESARDRDLPSIPKDEPVAAGAEGDTKQEPTTALPTASVVQKPVLTPPSINIPGADEEADDEDEEETASPASPAAAAAATSALGKEIAVDTPSKGAKVERKPVPAQAHPALRPRTKEGPPASSVSKAEPQRPTSATNAAAIAAARAMTTSSPSPESQKLKKQPGGPSGFKKLFGRKQDKGRDSFEARTGGNLASLSPPSDTNLSRRLSLMRKKPVNKAAVAQVSAPQPPPEAFQEPTALHNQFDDSSRVDTRPDANADDEFSRFDQGPTNDVPLPAVHHDEQPVDEAIPAPVPSRHYNTALASRIAPEHQEAEPSFVTPLEHPSNVDDDDVQSETTMEEHPPPRSMEPAQDRWAQIRDNAARRAARASEEQSMQSRKTGHSTRETDDGETSGEETIESRVARIKARVAELTGNIESSGTTVRR
ncbi:hypothetical protein Tdes44962_MAKER01667 [Teratosphaeria destructans]|uniref:Meiotically up-regulated protein Msb1/Mug8 domain-containing protein n=1 Tax=Teratosphaeria destructans TaxID=418781 RepID=A0A9W7SY01_9PEZI|nr:hypothetical protein Tdes44962_MAKER01667 [Teratosphaeria destructans]